MFPRLASILVIGALVFGAFMVASVGASPRIDARVRCAHPAEDTLAHVRMVRYTHAPDGGIIVIYRCERNGY